VPPGKELVVDVETFARTGEAVTILSPMVGVDALAELSGKGE